MGYGPTAVTSWPHSPASTGVPQSHHGNYSFYAVADQMIWRPDPDEPRSIGVFTRLMGAPGDRNLVSFAANAGIVTGDVIATLAGRSVKDLGGAQVQQYLSSGSIGIGTTVQLGLARGATVVLTSVKW